jgi:hypothetical protein
MRVEPGREETVIAQFSSMLADLRYASPKIYHSYEDLDLIALVDFDDRDALRRLARLPRLEYTKKTLIYPLIPCDRGIPAPTVGAFPDGGFMCFVKLKIENDLLAKFGLELVDHIARVLHQKLCLGTNWILKSLGWFDLCVLIPSSSLAEIARLVSVIESLTLVDLDQEFRDRLGSGFDQKSSSPFVGIFTRLCFDDANLEPPIPPGSSPSRYMTRKIRPSARLDGKIKPLIVAQTRPGWREFLCSELRLGLGPARTASAGSTPSAFACSAMFGKSNVEVHLDEIDFSEFVNRYNYGAYFTGPRRIEASHTTLHLPTPAPPSSESTAPNVPLPPPAAAFTPRTRDEIVPHRAVDKFIKLIGPSGGFLSKLQISESHRLCLMDIARTVNQIRFNPFINIYFKDLFAACARVFDEVSRDLMIVLATRTFRYYCRLEPSEKRPDMASDDARWAWSTIHRFLKRHPDDLPPADWAEAEKLCDLADKRWREVAPARMRNIAKFLRVYHRAFAQRYTGEFTVQGGPPFSSIYNVQMQKTMLALSGMAYDISDYFGFARQLPCCHLSDDGRFSVLSIWNMVSVPGHLAYDPSSWFLLFHEMSLCYLKEELPPRLSHRAGSLASGSPTAVTLEMELDKLVRDSVESFFAEALADGRQVRDVNDALEERRDALWCEFDAATRDGNTPQARLVAGKVIDGLSAIIRDIAADVVWFHGIDSLGSDKLDRFLPWYWRRMYDEVVSYVPLDESPSYHADALLRVWWAYFFIENRQKLRGASAWLEAIENEAREGSASDPNDHTLIMKLNRLICNDWGRPFIPTNHGETRDSAAADPAVFAARKQIRRFTRLKIWPRLLKDFYALMGATLEPSNLGHADKVAIIEPHLRYFLESNVARYGNSSFEAENRQYIFRCIDAGLRAPLCDDAAAET